MYEQTYRLIRAGVFDRIVHDLRVLPRLAAGRTLVPTAAIFDARTLQSSVERGCPLGSIAWTARFGRLVHGYERLHETLAGSHLAAFVFLMLQRAFANSSSHPLELSTFSGVENVALAPS